MLKDISVIVDDLLLLQQKYSTTYRGLVTEERYKSLVESGMITDYSYDSGFIREPLLEHVGHLPVIASHLHQYIEHRDEVDLGRVLIMLAVHDVAETELGDIITFAKKDEDVLAEVEVAKRLLPDYLYAYFEEIEERESMDGKFAKAVDSIAPLLHEMVLPTVTLERFKHHNFDVDKIVTKKKEHFEWDSVLWQIFEELVSRYRMMEKKVE